MFSKILSLFKKPQVETNPAPHPLDGPTKQAIIQEPPKVEEPLVKLEQYQEVVVAPEPVTVAKGEFIPEEAPKKKAPRKKSVSQKSGPSKKKKSKSPSTKA